MAKPASFSYKLDTPGLNTAHLIQVLAYIHHEQARLLKLTAESPPEVWRELEERVDRYVANQVAPGAFQHVRRAQRLGLIQWFHIQPAKTAEFTVVCFDMGRGLREMGGMAADEAPSQTPGRIWYADAFTVSYKPLTAQDMRRELLRQIEEEREARWGGKDVDFMMVARVLEGEAGAAERQQVEKWCRRYPSLGQTFVKLQQERGSQQPHDDAG